MKGLFKNYSLPENLEVLFLLVFGILLQMTDGSPFTMKERWMIVWDTELPVEYFSQFVQKVIKTVLSMIVVVRCATTYAYVVSAMLVIFCLIKDSAPKLMLLWLLIAGLKSVLLTFVEALAGVYVCSAFGQIRKACIEFVVSKAMEIIFASYLWGSVLNIYQEMERKAEENVKPEMWEQVFIQRGEYGRQRARSLLDESTLYKTACLNNFEFKDVPQIILQMLRRGDEMSNDSLLDPGMMLASVSNMGSFDNLKTSQSLGELGFVDLRSAQVVGLEEEEALSPQDKALKFLKLTWSDVRRAQRNKTGLEKDFYRIDKETWRRVIANGTHINKPKRARAEVFIREIQQVEPEDESRKPRKRSFDLKFSWSFFNLYSAKHVSLEEAEDEEEDESMVLGEDEDEMEEGEEEEREDEEPTPLFMSNIKEEVVVNRIRLDFVSKKMKGNTYAELYKQDYMSVIGPEVFEKATKLKKVTSLSKINNYTEVVTSMSLPTFSETAMTSTKKKILFHNNSGEKIYQTSSSELELNDEPEPAETEKDLDFEKEEEESTRDAVASSDETDSAEDKNLTDSPFHVESDKVSLECEEKSEKLEPESKDRFSGDSEHSDTNENSENTSSTPTVSLKPDFAEFVEQTPPCYRKRRIRIRRIGRQKASPASSVLENLSNSKTCFDQSRSQSKTTFGGENWSGHERSEMQSTQSSTRTSLRGLRDEEKSFLPGQSRQMYFLTDLLQQPLFDVLMTYYDLKNGVHVRKKANTWFWKEKGEFSFRKGKLRKNLEEQLQPRESDERQEKNWKSEVLKTVEAYRRDSSQASFFDVTEKCVSRKLLEYYIRRNYLLETEKEILLSLCIANGLGVGGSESETVCAVSGSEGSLVEEEAERKRSSGRNLDKAADLEKSSNEEDLAGTRSSGSENSGSEWIDVICRKVSKVSLEEDGNLKASSLEILKSDTDFGKLKAQDEEIHPSEEQEDLEFVAASEVFRVPTEVDSTCSQESDEPISLYYSKAANLASPLLDVKRFIYPDHIHYSYKHVKKKGFDVDISGGFPLLVRESLTLSTPLSDSMSTQPEFTITRRPMDLSFATTNAFAEWQNNDQSDVDSILSEAKQSRPKVDSCSGKRKQKPSSSDLSRGKKSKAKKTTDSNDSPFSLATEFGKSKPKLYQSRNLTDFKHLYSTKDYMLIEKLLKMHLRFNSKDYPALSNSETERTPVQISSTQLHSNKGRINSTYNPAIFLQENKTRNEKKKMETQEERTKDMFARLEREALLHSKNVHRSNGPSRRI